MSLFIEGPAKAGLVAGVMGTFFLGPGRASLGCPSPFWLIDESAELYPTAGVSARLGVKSNLQPKHDSILPL